jgi:hypothetical protein
MSKRPVPEFDKDSTLREYFDAGDRPVYDQACPRCRGTGVTHTRLTGYPMICSCADDRELKRVAERFL